MKIGFLGDGPWAHNSLEKLLDDGNYEVMFLTVRWDTRDPILLKMAEENNVPVYLSPNINSKEYMDLVKKSGAEILVSMSFNQIFKSEIINLLPKKTINCHAGKLPFYRGRNILNWALINDEKEFGITVHYVDEGIDTGDIIYQQVYPITDTDNYDSLLKTAHRECSKVLFTGLEMIRTGKVKPIKQETIHPVGTYFGARMDGDEMINWNDNSRNIFNFIRAICKPAPMARTVVNGKTLFINKAEEIKNAIDYKCICGQIVGKDGDNLIIKTGDNIIKITEYEYEGRLRIGDRCK